MTVRKINIVFTAVCDTFRFNVENLKLGGIYPEISISVVEENSGVHEFSIIKYVQGYGGEFIDAAVKEASRQIEYFWNVLAYVQDTVIKPVGPVFYSIKEGERIKVEKQVGGVLFGVRIIADISSRWFDLNKREFTRRFDIDLLKRYNFAKAIDEPIGRFISLYSLFATLAGDRQDKIDALLEDVDPTIEKGYGFKGKIETIYTRLRNELAHERKGASIMQTHEEIKAHLLTFEKIVRSVLGRHIFIEG